jgi:hypothetical protein
MVPSCGHSPNSPAVFAPILACPKATEPGNLRAQPVSLLRRAHSLRVVTGERVPIGGRPEPGRVFGRVPHVLYPFLPQRAWLEGSVLTVEGRQGTRRCDLASASKIAFRYVPPIGSWSFLVLYAWQEPDSPPARLVLDGPGWLLLTADHLRMLAQVIGSRPGEPSNKIKRIVRRLGDLADYDDLHSKPIDWSFRTDPQGRRRSGDVVRPPD